MKITVPTTSTSLETILGERIHKINIKTRVLEFIVSIQNLGDTDIYLEYISPATVEEGYIVPKNNQVDLRVNDFEQLNLISQTTENKNVRIIIN